LGTWDLEKPSRLIVDRLNQLIGRFPFNVYPQADRAVNDYRFPEHWYYTNDQIAKESNTRASNRKEKNAVQSSTCSDDFEAFDGVLGSLLPIGSTNRAPGRPTLPVTPLQPEYQ
jgi:hypothetical protein